MAKLQVKFEWKDGYLLVTTSGQATMADAVETYKKACDLATEKGIDRILVDNRSVEAQLSTLDRYKIGQTIAQYCLDRSINPKVANVGGPPTTDGFATRVAANRGVVTATFSDMKPALDWLAAFSPIDREKHPPT